MEKVLKIGIIGCGAIGKDHCRRIIETVPGATVVAVSDYVAAAADDHRRQVRHQVLRQ